MEELDLRSSSGVAKFLGALVSVLGAFIITLYKGQKILLTSPFTESPHELLQSQESNWVLAGPLLAIAFLSFALSNIFQAILGCVVHSGASTWCLQEKGPVFVAMFKPVGIAIAVVMASLFLGDPLYLGSVIGAVIIALGFYTVMWGKAKEQKLVPKDEICCLESSSERTPLLQNKHFISPLKCHCFTHTSLAGALCTLYNFIK